MIEKLRTFLNEERGLTIVEYAVAAGMITLLVVGAFTDLGGAVQAVITTITGFITAAP